MIVACRLLLASLVTAAASLLAAGCSNGPSGSTLFSPAPGASVALLRPGDSLVIAIQGVPDPSQNPVQIDEEGLISLPYIGAISAAGMTSAELSQAVRQTYVQRNIYTSVDVSVAVTERFVYVGGEVARPGRIIWTPDLTLTKALQAAGGMTLYARERRVILTRERQAYDVDVRAAQRNPGEDPLLFPGDSIQVPRAPF